jgi:phosphatidylglycerol:prolipoprotein diacylglycerol transferase
MIPYPEISPVIFSIGPFQLRWYGTMYLLGFAVGYLVMRKLTGKREGKFKGDVLLDFLGYVALGLVVGGRLGYVLFYNLDYYLQRPWEIVALWKGGLSFHGGFVGVILTGIWFSRRRGIPFYEMADTAIIPLPIGLGLGRIGNFINGELFGRPTQVPWCMVFPNGGPQCRHPSQLYEALLEGLVLFLVMWTVGKRSKQPGVPFWTFVALYGVARFLVEFTREPDPQLGLILGPFSMGQVLSMPMIFLGAAMLWTLKRKVAVPRP